MPRVAVASADARSSERAEATRPAPAPGGQATRGQVTPAPLAPLLAYRLGSAGDDPPTSRAEYFGFAPTVDTSPPVGAGRDRKVIEEMEAAFGVSFTDVQLRTDRGATQRAAELGARAYTDGREIGFARGEFAPTTHDGLRTIAHEFAHVAQMRGGTGGRLPLVSVGLGSVRSFIPDAALDDEVEADAEVAATAVVDGRTPEVADLALAGLGEVRRKPKTPPAPPLPGTYVVQARRGRYSYIFNAKDVLEWSDPWLEAARAHFHNLYPGAPADAEQGCLDSIKKREIEGGDPREVARKSQSVKFDVEPSVHAGMVGWMSEHYKTLRPSTPVEATHGLEGAKGPTGPVAPPAPTNVEDVNGRKFRTPVIKAEDREKILSVLRDVFGPVDPAKEPTPPPETSVSDRTTELLLQIANSSNRDAIVARFKSTGAPPPTGGPAPIEWILETAIANTELEDARKALGLVAGRGTWGEEPIERRPVHGRIVNKTGYLVPGIEGRFEFKVLDDRDALRVPIISIIWVAHPAGQPATHTSREVTNYVPVRAQSFLEDRIFNFTFDKAGSYVVEALVNHNFFLPNHFAEPVEVVEEPTLAAQLAAEANKGFVQPGVTAAHVYDVGGVTGAQMGTITRGKLDPKFTILTIEDRLKAAEDEKALVQGLITQYEGQKTAEARSVVKWAKNYLETLEKSRKRLTQDKGATSLGVRGAFASRVAGVPSKALGLLCYFQKLPTGYRMILHDFTHLTEPDDYRFEATALTVEGAAQQAFLMQADAYPFGTLSVTFQSWDETKNSAKDEYVTLTKVTDTVGKHVKHIVFDVAVDIAVNLAAAIMMVIPGLQPLGIAIAIAYNTAKTLSELQEAANKGTLTAGKVAIGVAQIALNLIPLAGRGAKLLTIAGKTFYAVEAVTWAGNALLVTASGMDAVEQLRNGVIKDLAETEGKIRELEKVNLAHPDLPKLKAERERLIKDGQSATGRVFSELIATQAFMMVGQHLISGYVERRLSIGELKNQGRFKHKPDAQPGYDWEAGQIVGDELKINAPELEHWQAVDAHNRALKDTVPDVSARRAIVEALGERPVEVRTGADKTALVREGNRLVLNVADGESPATILAEAKKAPTEAPPAKPPADKPPAKPDEGFKPVEPEELKGPEVEPVKKELEPLDPKAAEAKAEAELQLEAQARQAYQEAVKRGYGKKKGPEARLDERGFIDRYKEGQYYDYEGKPPRWKAVGRPAAPPPEPFPAGSTTDNILNRLAGPNSKSSFKKYYELLKSSGVADETKVREAIDDVRRQLNLDNESARVDDVRHALKQKFREQLIDAMLNDPSGQALDPKTSHQKMLEMTSKLDPADKGTLAEDWVQHMRERAATDPTALADIKGTPKQVVVRKEDHPAMAKDRRLDRVEGETVNEIKSGDGYLSADEKGELIDHLALVGEQGAQVDVRGKSQTVKKVKWTFLSPEGGRRNVDWMVEQLMASDKLSFEVYNDAHESRVFTRADVTGPNEGNLHQFLGKPVKKGTP